jgi:hypothetical protein
MTGIFDWSAVAASNATADSSINWAEGQAANTVNNSARAMMVRIRQFLDDTQGALVTAGGSGSPNAYTVATNSGITALRAGVGFLVRIHQTNTGAATLNADGLGAKGWKNELGSDFQSGDLAAEMFVPVYYHAGTDTLRSRINVARSSPHGGCILEYTSASTITLRGMEDGFLRVNGVSKRVPPSGVTAPATGKQTPIGTTNRVVTGSVATLTLAAAHTMVVGQRVNVIDVSVPEIQGTQVISAVTGTTISYPVSLGSSASAGDTGGTVRATYNVYAYDNDGDGTIDTLELSGVGYSADSFGVQTKIGDTSRVLVGMVGIDSSAGTPIFVNTDLRPWVRSYFNRSASPMAALFTAVSISGTANNNTWNEIGSRFEPLLWAGEALSLDVNGAYNTTSAPATLQVTWQVDTWNGIETPTSNTTVQTAASNCVYAKRLIKKGLAEGMHTVVPIGNKNAGTAVFNGHQSAAVFQ